jgi:hypothetical protein
VESLLPPPNGDHDSNSTPPAAAAAVANLGVWEPDYRAIVPQSSVSAFLTQVAVDAEADEHEANVEMGRQERKRKARAKIAETIAHRKRRIRLVCLDRVAQVFRSLKQVAAP